MASELEPTPVLGRTVHEGYKNGVWKGTGSNPSWVIGVGHKSLDETRRMAVEELNAAEVKVLNLMSAYEEAKRVRTTAIRDAEKAKNALADARLSLAQAQRKVAERCGFMAAGNLVDDQ